MSKEDIYITVCNILEDKEILTQFELEEKYKDFKEKFFRIFDLCISSTEDKYNDIKQKISLMLNIRDDVKTGKKSDIEANVQVGEYCAKLYIYPKTGEPTIEQKKEALKKIIAGEKKRKEEI